MQKRSTCRGLNFRLHDATPKDIRKLPLSGLMHNKCVGFMQEAGQVCYEARTNVVTPSILRQCSGSRNTLANFVKHCVTAGVLTAAEGGKVIRDMYRDAVNMTPQQTDAMSAENQRRGRNGAARTKARREAATAQKLSSGFLNENNNLGAKVEQPSLVREKDKEKKHTAAFANEMADRVPSAPAPTPPAQPEASVRGMSEKCMSEKMATNPFAAAVAAIQARANAPELRAWRDAAIAEAEADKRAKAEAGRKQGLAARHARAAARLSGAACKRADGRVDAERPAPATPPPNEGEVIAALAAMDVPRRETTVMLAMRAMMALERIEKLALDNAVWEYKKRKDDPTREPIGYAPAWLPVRLAAGQRHLEARRRACDMPATFAEAQAAALESQHGGQAEKQAQAGPAQAGEIAGRGGRAG